MICCVFCELINVLSCCVATVIVRDLLSMCNIKLRVYTVGKITIQNKSYATYRIIEVSIDRYCNI